MMMKLTKLAVPQPKLLLTGRGATTHDVSRAIRRQCDSGELIRLGRGAYLAASEWAALDDRARHIAQMRAAQARHSTPIVFVHDSAAAVLDYPAYGYFSTVPQAISRQPRQSTSQLRWHRGELADDEIVECDGFFITSPERTLWDIACTAPFARAVGMLDAGIRTLRPKDAAVSAPRVDREHLLERVSKRSGKRGTVRAARSIGFARDGADSLGESLSRVQEYLFGFEEPELQVTVSDVDGDIGVADQCWREHRLLGEFDGYEKYTRNRYTHGKAPSDVVFDEKVREDRMRATGGGMARWLWVDAHSGSRLAAILTRAGLPRESRPRDDWGGMPR
ncbi:hypothetical protein [Paramicrobacterium chengjingii]|uniref:Transcriptional regulator, AbiEi antitoxin, Type IV TA system n=1 Tax=Paramicrobacterium chengjingii TaxID=2769067 RepID=A0ABX6YFG7_9MICO|nr:hypothetical protein [Microbacterium chengjingii]QPZ37415.1 hypothetical protein HCR76_11260 [Microbacterium chengjingii]